MGAQLALTERSEAIEDNPFDDQWTAEGPKWEMKKLTPKHQQVGALLAQGMKNVEIAALVGFTPEYVSMLLRQPLMRQYIAEKCEIAGVRMDALFEQAVEVISDTMKNGSEGGKLKAARLQLEATKRIGRPDPHAIGLEGSVDRLTILANRLLDLQSGVKQGKVFDQSGQEITDVG